MSRRRVHLQAPGGVALCATKGSTSLTEDPEAVTCKFCLERLTAPDEPTTLTQGFYSKVVGVTFDNPDGRNRQRIIARCALGESLQLEREPDNPADPNAVKVLRTNGDQLGYLPAYVAEEIAPLLKPDGSSVQCTISSLTGDGPQTRGVNIYLGNPPADLQTTGGASEPGGKTGCSAALLLLVALAAAFLAMAR